MKEPGCVPTGANGHAAYTRAMFAEVRHHLHLFFCVSCVSSATYLIVHSYNHLIVPHLSLAGGSSDEGKQGGVMVEFDDGDRGKISLPNIRLLPPGYQIHCEYLLSL